MVLFINTTDFDIVHFAIIKSSQKNNEVKKFSKSLAFNENFRTLELLEKFLLKEKVKLKQIEKIIVCSGPGSFTGIRVGISMAQALSFALGVPLSAIPKDKIPEDLTKLQNIKLAKKFTIDYGRKPNITPPKK